MKSSPHDFAIATHLGFRICRRCAKTDLSRTRTRPCQPLPPAELRETLKCKLDWVGKFRGLTPFASRQGEA